MANEVTPNHFDGKKISAKAAESMSGGLFVNWSAGYEALACSIADSGDEVDGISCEDVTSGRGVSVAYCGVGLLRVDATTAILIGDYLKPASDSSGVGVKSAADNEKCGAVAMQALASGTGIIRVMILPRTERSVAGG